MINIIYSIHKSTRRLLILVLSTSPFGPPYCVAVGVSLLCCCYCLTSSTTIANYSGTNFNGLLLPALTAPLDTSS